MRRWLGTSWRHLSAWYDRQIEAPRLLLGCVLCLTLGSGIVLGYMTISADPIALLPARDPAVLEYALQQEHVGATNVLRILVDTEQPALGPAVVDTLAERIRALPNIMAVYARPPIDFYDRAALLYLPYDELDAFATTVERRLHELTFQQWVTDLHVPEPPLSVEPLYARYPFAQRRAYYQTDDGRHFAVLVRSTKSPGDTAWSVQFVGAVQQIIDQTLAAVPVPPGAPAPVHVTMAGEYVQVTKQAHQITRDTIVVTLIACLGLSLYLGLLYRNLWRTFTVMAPLLVGTCWSYAAAQTLLGGLNFFTVGTCMLTLGVCSGMGIRMVYYFDHQADPDAALAVQVRAATGEFFRTMRIPGLVIIAALIFLTFAKLRALSQFGMLAGVSIALHIVSLFCLAPWTLRHLTRRTLTPIPMRLQNLLGGLVHWLSQTDGFITVTCGGVVLALSLCLRLPVVNVDLTHLLFSTESTALPPTLDRIAHAVTYPEIIRAATRADATAFARALRAHARDRTDAPFFSVLALDDFIPDDQDRKIARLQQLRAAFTPTAVAHLTPEDQLTYDLLRPALTPVPVTTDTLPAEVRQTFQPLDGDLGTFAYIFPDVSVARAKDLARFAQTLRATQCPDCSAPVHVSGEVTLFYSMIEHIIPEQILGTTGAAAVIFLLMFLVLRSRRDVVLCGLPPLATVLLTMGALVWGEVELNMLNVGAIPLIMGFAVNATMIMQQQLTRTGKMLLTSYIRTAAFLCTNSVAVVICFTAMSFARNPGLSTFGHLSAIGTTIGVAAALLWFPGLVQTAATLFPLPAPGKIPSAKSPRSASVPPPPASDENSVPS